VSALTAGFASVDAGGSHSCALSTSGGVWCWGLNNHGQVGNGGSGFGIFLPVSVARVTSGVGAISLGGEHSCVVMSSGEAKCWGRNDEGQLGVSDSTSRFRPTTVVGLESGVASVDAAGKHTCAVTTTGAVKCWGLNDHGALGDGTTEIRRTPTDVSGLGSGVVAVALGGQHSCALTNAGAVKCWGLNSSGQVGNGSVADAWTPVAVSGLGSGVASISAGGAYTCAQMTSGSLKCWGAGASGQVGDGTATQRLVPTDVPGATSNVAAVSAGRAHACLEQVTGLTKCWAENESGQLGDGTTIDLYGPFLPDPPTAVVAVRGDHQATVSWNAPVSDGGYPLSGYTVTSSPATAPAQVGPGVLNATVTGLTNGTAYRFTVKATNTVGSSRSSVPSNAVTPAGLPRAPTKLAVTTGDRRATISWRAAARNGSAITSYRVVASPGAKAVTVSGASTRATLTGLVNGTTYTFGVRARNAVGTGPAASISKRLPIPQSGYWMLGKDGAVYAFGKSQMLGSASYSNWGFGVAAVAIAPRRDGAGYWIVDSSGGVRAFGLARFYGDHPRLAAGEQASTIAATPTGRGYWIFTNRGRAFPYGDATFYGDLRNLRLDGPVIASSATPSGHGYYMIGSDGGVFCFGDSRFRGSMGGKRLDKPVVGLSPTPTGRGYWLVASDGGVFAFGDAPFRGSMGGKPLNQPVNGLVPFGNGYLMVASDGGVFNFSDKPFFGSLGANPPAAPIVGIAAFTWWK
jgi:hypothetical protein